MQKATAAEAAGLKPGDKITSINGAPVTTWNQFRRTIQEGHEVTLTVQRGEETLTIKGSPQKQGEDYVLGFKPRVRDEIVEDGFDCGGVTLRVGLQHSRP